MGPRCIGAGITAFYMTRLFFMTFHGEKRWTEDVHPHESPQVMTVPMIVLAVGSAFARPASSARRASITDWLEPVVGAAAEDAARVLPVLVITGR